jgi:hypothetical protein
MGYEELRRTSKPIASQALSMIHEAVVRESIRKNGVDVGVDGAQDTPPRDS